MIDLETGTSTTFDTLTPELERIRASLNSTRNAYAGIVELETGKRTYVEINEPPLRLILVGAVHITQAILPMADNLGYDTYVVDPRSGFANEARFPGYKLIVKWPDAAFEEIGLDHRTAVCALTHDPKIDDPALRAALRSDVYYIGALGSRRTHAKRLERLEEVGIDATSFNRINAPIGLHIGAIGAIGETEIALSIMAELTRVTRLGPAKE